MQRTNPQFRNAIRRSSSSLAPVALAAALTGCMAEASEAPAAEPLPAPGSIEVTKPLELAGRARVPEKEAGFLSAQVKDRSLVLEHDGRLPAFAAGDVLGGTAGGGYLVRVTRVLAEAGGRAELETEPAALTELLREGRVHVHYDAADYERRLDHAIREAKALGDEAGEQIARQAQALKVTSGVAIDLLELTGGELPAKCGIEATGQADLDVKATLTPVIDLDLHVGPKGGWDPTPELKEFRLVVSGTLQVDATLHGSGKIAGSCTLDLLELAGGAPTIPLPSLTFWVGAVPVVVTSEVVPTATARVELGLSAADLTAEAHAKAGLMAGVQYQNKSWSTLWDPWGTASGSASIESPGDVTASCKVSAGAELRARLYGILGPTLGVQAYARATAETSPPYCTYDARIDGGVEAYAEAEAGVSVGPLDLTLVSLPLLDFELAHFDGPAFEGDLRNAPECSQGW